MGSEDAIKIAVSLIITVILLTVMFTYTKGYNKTITNKTTDVVQLVYTGEAGPAKQANRTVKSGTDALSLVDYYSSGAPVLIVTEELYRTGQKYSYDTMKCHEKLYPEYINPELKYYVDAEFDNENHVSWLRVVQSTLTGEPDLPTVSNTYDAYMSSSSTISLHNQLVDKQYRAYLKDLE